MSTCSISIIPKTSGTSVSEVVARCVKVLEKYPDLKWELTPMSTQIEAPTSRLFEVLQEMHSAPFDLGVQRVYTVITIDDRRDKPTTLENKVSSVKSKLTP
ncbi:MAG: MTH1187 family thiamine-binding protein [bacterium]|nr:MTH1187 family thiamine-binding protein [bacterium]